MMSCLLPGYRVLNVFLVHGLLGCDDLLGFFSIRFKGDENDGPYFSGKVFLIFRCLDAVLFRSFVILGDARVDFSISYDSGSPDRSYPAGLLSVTFHVLLYSWFSSDVMMWLPTPPGRVRTDVRRK